MKGTLGMKLIKGDDRRRFFSKVERTEGCWLWQGYRNAKGYGTLYVQGKMTSAHRFAYQLLVGPIPEGLMLDHLCRVPACVNPDHLEPVNNRENILRGISPPAVAAAKTECHRGHPFDEANTYVFRNLRQCRACRKFVNRGARGGQSR